MAEEEKPALDNESTPQQIATFKKTIIPKLRALGVRKLTVNYSGSGDEGSVDGMDVEPEGLAIPEELEKQICDLADEFLYSEHGTWEDGDGGTGMIVIDPAEGKIVNEHGWYSTDVTYETKEF
ncbi:MAG TPA: hypothetical protein VGR84_02365 [Candidatus Acidoferrales bacterium]|nr:hypothetical protein [Candidatus Acidoferrales bacterium]